MIIGISGKAQSGKDTVGKIIQYLTIDNKLPTESINNLLYDRADTSRSIWQIVKFADKVKDIVCLLIGCTREQLEDEKFKNKELGEEWKFTLEQSKDYYVGEALIPRKLLQLVGTDCGRDVIHPNIWINATMREYKPKDAPYNNLGDLLEDKHNGLLNNPNWIITDVRFPNEVEAIEDRGGFIIRVERDVEHDCTFCGKTVREQKKGCNEISCYRQHLKHPSETVLDNHEFKYTIDNNSSIENLIDKVKEILIKEKII